MGITKITCPWCGTNYTRFQSNCKNCGGPLPLPEEQAAVYAIMEAPDERVPDAPPAPREISNGYVWKLLLTDGWGITALVLLIMGAVFFPVGMGLIAGIVTAFVGIPFAGLGLLFLGGGIGLGKRRYDEKMKTVEVLRHGLPAVGEITYVEVNRSVTVNGRNPWTIEYVFEAEGDEQEGKVTTLNRPGTGLQEGRKARVLYLEGAAQHSTLYPHP